MNKQAIPATTFRSRPADYWAWALCLLLLGIAVAYPCLRLLWRAAFLWDMGVLTGDEGYAPIRNTLLISLASVASSGVAGTGLALFLNRYAFPGSRLLAVLAYLPFTLPPLVGVVAFYFLIGRDGLIPVFLERCMGWRDAYPQGPLAILLIHTYSFYVFFYAMVSPALGGIDASLAEAARNLGASRWRVFYTVTLPLLRPSLAGASLLTFMSSTASFSAPLLFGHDFPMLSVRIYEANTQFNEREALTLTLALALMSLLGILLFRTRSKPFGQASKGAPRAMRSEAARTLAAFAAGAVLFVLLIPHIVIIWMSFVDHARWRTELIPAAFTFANYIDIFRDPRALAPIRNSLWMSGAGAFLAVLAGLPAGYLIGRKRMGWRWLSLLAAIPWALPGTVVAMTLLISFNDPWMPRNTIIWLLPLAYFVRSAPLFTRMATAAIEPFDAGLIEAGRTLGAGPWRVFWTVAAPMLAPALLAAASLVFATSLGEFVSSILLYRPANIPIAVRINMELRGANIGSAFAYSVFLMALTGMTFAGAKRFTGKVA